MKIRKALLLAALLVLGVFFVHIVSMLPDEEALSRAEALESLLAEEFPPASGSEERALSEPEGFRCPDRPEKLREVGAKGFESAREVCA